MTSGEPAARKPRRGWASVCGRAWLPAALLVATTAAAAPREMDVRLDGARDNRICQACHGDPGWAQRHRQSGGRSLLVDGGAFTAGAHAGRACTDCHGDIRAIPHGPAEPVRCGRCHPDKEAPTDARPAGAAPIHQGAHSRALREGKPAPRCATCHGTHEILPPEDRRSRIHRASIPSTCGRCHAQELDPYRSSIHGKAAREGKSDAAVCTDCHGEHERLLPPADSASSISPARIPDTCSHCHESLPLAKRNGIPTRRLATYRESYHGIVSRYGDKAAANCASCHGSHDILPSSDPASRVNRGNLARTCGKCHSGAGDNFARGTVHLLPSAGQDAPVYWVRLFYRIFISLLMVQFVGLILLDLLSHRRRRRRGGQPQ